MSVHPALGFTKTPSSHPSAHAIIKQTRPLLDKVVDHITISHDYIVIPDASQLPDSKLRFAGLRPPLASRQEGRVDTTNN